MVRYHVGELPPDRGKTIDRHLRGCKACRLEYRRLTSAFDGRPRSRGAGECLPVNDPGQLAGLLAGIQGWESAAAEVGHTGEGIKRRVAGKMEKYLGAEATSQILQSVPDDGGNLLSTIEPVLTLFLGRRAASLLVSRIVEAAIVRI